jgi:glycosyltransferase involved in cell wall biosynthesis
MTSCDLSIIIIARNEASNIARAIKSALLAIQHLPRGEVLLVDSASTDETVEIAKQYPIDIVRLDPLWFLSVAAGRHIGMHYTRGELVLHMDGDMELDPEWVNQSMSFILERPQVAAVGGYWRNTYMRDGQITGEEDQNRDPQGRVLEVQYVGGASLYRRSAIERVGGFQPFIRGEEDVELCMRLRHAGYKVVRLPYLMSRHYCIPLKSWAGNIRRLRLNLWLGHGQVPRYHWKTGLFWTYLKERGTFVVYFIAMLISLITLLLTLFSRNVIFFGGWLLIVGVFLLVFWVKKRSLRKTLLSCLLQTFVAYSAVRGFLMTPRSPAEYPVDAEIVQLHSRPI